MPNWNNKPPEDLGRSGFRLIRTPTAHPITAHVLSENLVGCNTHYVGNRTIPCEAPHCDACESGIAWRWHGYILILIAATQETAIFEMTAKASAPFAEYYERTRTLRGCFFKAQRLNGRTNGRVLIQTKTVDLARIVLPPPIPVEKLLCHIWNIPPADVTTADAMTRPPFQHTQVDRNNDIPILRMPPATPINHHVPLHPEPQGNNQHAKTE